MAYCEQCGDLKQHEDERFCDWCFCHDRNPKTGKPRIRTDWVNLVNDYNMQHRRKLVPSKDINE